MWEQKTTKTPLGPRGVTYASPVESPESNPQHPKTIKQTKQSKAFVPLPWENDQGAARELCPDDGVKSASAVDGKLVSPELICWKSQLSMERS